jgi:hypothetical protein
MLSYSSQVSWILIAAFALSLLYELYRATAKAGASKHDSVRSFLTPRIALLRHRLRPGGAGADGTAMGGLDGPGRWGGADHATTQARPTRLVRGQALHGVAVCRGRPACL